MAVLRMSTEELSRVETLMHVVSGRMTVTEAARLMSVSRRHAHRLLTRYLDDWTCNGFVPVTYLTMPPWLRTRAG